MDTNAGRQEMSIIDQRSNTDEGEPMMRQSDWLRRTFTAVSVIALALLAWGALPAATRLAETRTLTGPVDGVEYDENGEATLVSIDDEDLGFVLVADSGRGHELLQYVGSTVRATGSIDQNEDGEYVINVATYTVVANEDPESSNDEDDDDEYDDD
jgi:hypothetical protein